MAEKTHQHQHHHHHGDGTHGNLVTENKKYFDNMASTYTTTESHVRTNEYVVEAVLRLDGIVWDEDKTRVLDYACGGGLVSKGLAPYAKEIVGMDVSEKMVEVYNEQVSNQGILSSEMRAVMVDICAEQPEVDLTRDEYNNFDVAVCAFAFHHFPDVPLATKKIVERLKPGSGMLVVADFKPYEDVPDATAKFKHVVSHNGFSSEAMEKYFKDAGLVDIEFAPVGPKGAEGKGITITAMFDTSIKFQREAFLVKGRRA